MSADATKTAPCWSGTGRTPTALSDDRGRGAVIKSGIEDLSPAYFALVMATGIISIALDMLGMSTAGVALFVVNIVAYATLTVLSLRRVIWFNGRFFGDMLGPPTGPRLFLPRSLPHASSALSARSSSIILPQRWCSSSPDPILGSFLPRIISTALTVKRIKPPLEEGITGAWLLAIVATQSVAVLIAMIAARWPQSYRLELNIVARSVNRRRKVTLPAEELSS